ncbi:putative insoluble matrix shell protein 4-like [Sesbania bispinosa]|nr:putative insoluble matrix shell protein 4-like [Sesbania bispinosa]
MSGRFIQNVIIIKLPKTEEAAGEGSKSTYYAGSFNNHGNGEQNFSRAKINRGAYSGDRNRYHTSNNYGDHTVNNSGTFNGHENGGFIDGDFNASTTNHNYRR